MKCFELYTFDLRYICWCPETDLASASGSDMRLRIVAFSKMVFNACLPHSFFPLLQVQPLCLFSMLQVSSHSMPLCVQVGTYPTAQLPHFTWSVSGFLKFICVWPLHKAQRLTKCWLKGQMPSKWGLSLMHPHSSSHTHPQCNIQYTIYYTRQMLTASWGRAWAS